MEYLVKIAIEWILVTNFIKGDIVLKESSCAISFTSRSFCTFKKIHGENTGCVSESSSKIYKSLPVDEPSDFIGYDKESSKCYVFANKNIVTVFQIYLIDFHH